MTFEGTKAVGTVKMGKQSARRVKKKTLIKIDHSWVATMKCVTFSSGLIPLLVALTSVMNPSAHQLKEVPPMELWWSEKR
ncbi:hypothetical protein Scep_025587 [Stephania cephalantha]|uniref:Uncharacterized protein n=1 Tax=Stephania cephalantha TaxID=152367 RepID=A0AAP0EQU3_9MAGN